MCGTHHFLGKIYVLVHKPLSATVINIENANDYCKGVAAFNVPGA